MCSRIEAHVLEIIAGAKSMRSKTMRCHLVAAFGLTAMLAGQALLVGPALAADAGRPAPVFTKSLTQKALAVYHRL